MKKRVNKKGFTLIELLATILVLAIIMMIAYPKVRKIIDESKRSAFLTTAKSVLKATDNFYGLKTSINDFTPGLVYDLVAGDTIKFTGGDFKTGEVMVDENGNTALALWDGAYCIVKDFDDENDELTIVKNKTGANCDVENVNTIIHSGTTGYLCADPGSTIATDAMYFTFNQGTKTITGYSDLGPKDLVIPCTIGGVNVENIGVAAFYGKSLTSVTMPDTIINIARISFAANKIANLSLGNSVQTISNGAFCENEITNLVLPDSLKTIESSATFGMDRCNDSTYTVGAFHDNKLVSVTTGANLESIGNNTFYGGVVQWSRNDITTLDLSRSKKLTNIGEYAFMGNLITSIELPSSVTTLKIGAFADNKIAELVIPNSLNTIGNSAFVGNIISSLTINGNTTTGLTIGTVAFQGNFIESLNMTGKITSIGLDAFKNNQLPDNKAYVMSRNADGTENGILASYGGANRSNLTIPNTVTSLTNASFNSLGLNGTLNTGNTLTIIEASKFSSNSLTKVIVGNGLVTLGSAAFYGNLLNEVTFTGSNLKTISRIAFAANKITTLNLGSGVETIANGAFCENEITTLVLPDSLKTIEDSATYGMDRCNDSSYTVGAFHDNKLTSVTTGANLESIGNNTFYGDVSQWSRNDIVTLDMSKSTKLTNIGEYAFMGNLLVNVDLPSGVTTIKRGSFASNKLVSVTFPSAVTTIGEMAFVNNKISSLVIPSSLLSIGNSAFVGNMISNLTINGNASTGLSIGTLAFQNNLIDTLSMSGKIISIGLDAFKNNQLPDNQAYIMSRNADGSENGILASYAGANRSNLTIPNTVTSLTNASFNSLGLNGTLNTGNTLTAIEDNKFSSNSLTSVIIGSGLVTLGKASFYGNLITDVNVTGTSLKTISQIAFAANKISTLNLGNGVETIANGAFCENELTTLVLPDSLKVIENSATYGMDRCNDAGYTVGAFHDNKLTSVTTGANLEFIGNNTFYGGVVQWSRNDIATLDMSRSTKLANIGEYAFMGNLITSVQIPGGVTTIKKGSFSSNTITTVTIPNTVTLIGENAFSNNIINSLTINGNAGLGLTIETTAFQNNLIETFSMTGKIVGIGTDAFKNNQLPDNQAYIMARNADGSENGILASYAGANRINLVIPDTVTSLAKASFSSLGLTGTLNTGNGLMAIEDYKFTSNSLTKVIVGNGLVTLGKGAFYGNLLTEVNVTGTNLKTISQIAFAANKISTLNLGNGVETIANGAFCENEITNLILPDSLKTIENGATYGMSSCNDSTYTVGAFHDNKLASVTTGANLESIGNNTFYGDVSQWSRNDITTLDMSRSTKLTNIGEYSFMGNLLTSVEIPASVLTIKQSTFVSNPGLSTILVKGKVNSSNFTSLGTNWNGSCNNIIYELASCYTYSGNTITNYSTACSKNVEIPTSLGGNTITTIGDNTFLNKNLTRVVIPSTIQNIGNSAFVGNTIDPIVVMGKTNQSNFTSLGTNWNDSSQVVYDLDDVTCFKTSSTIVTNYYNETVCPKNISLPSGITEIATNAFINKGLNSITIPSTVTTIGNTPFTGNLLSSITVNSGTNFTSLGTSWNGNVLKVNFLGTSIENNCFTTSGNSITKYQSYCPETVVIPTSVEGTSITSLAANSFKGSAVRFIDIPSTITSIGNNAFEGNDIVTLSIVSGLDTIGSSAFKDTGLLTLTLPNTVENIGAEAFKDNAGLTVINVQGKTSASDFTSLGTGWNGSCSNIVYLGN